MAAVIRPGVIQGGDGEMTGTLGKKNTQPMTEETLKKTIGRMNGGWAFLLKLFLAVFPVALTMGSIFGVWVAKNIYAFQAFQNEGDRWTPVDAHKQEDEIKEWVEEHYPPDDLTEDVKEVKQDVKVGFRDVNQELRMIDGRLRVIEGKVNK